MKIKTFRFIGNSRTSEEQAWTDINNAQRAGQSENLRTTISDESFYKEDEIINSFMVNKEIHDVKVNIYRITSLDSPDPKRPGSNMISHRSMREITILYDDKKEC